MAFDARDYDGDTPEEAADRQYQDRLNDAFGERMAAFDAGLCSLASAHTGGAVYERDIAETLLELTEVFGSKHIAEPVAVALAGWRESQRIAIQSRRAA